jgi:hypothetical protein
MAMLNASIVDQAIQFTVLFPNFSKSGKHFLVTGDLKI